VNKLYFFAGALIVYGLWFYEPAPYKRPPGVTVNENPTQLNITDQRAPVLLKGYELKARAEFSLKALVLSKERYRFYDSLTDLMPYDFALGWGRMSDQAIVDRYRISQGARFYMWSYSGEAPIPQGEVINASANMHLIPKSEDVFYLMKSVRAGDLINLKGYLVDVTKNQKSVIQTSLTRSDSGAGACEVVLVEELVIYD